MYNYSLIICSDATGCRALYEVRAVIEYHGTLTRDGVSQGHYTCDVKSGKCWFRTNDAQQPQEINDVQVTKKGSGAEGLN